MPAKVSSNSPFTICEPSDCETNAKIELKMVMFRRRNQPAMSSAQPRPAQRCARLYDSFYRLFATTQSMAPGACPATLGVRRHATNRRGYVRVGELQPVLFMHARRLIRKPALMQCPIQELP